MVSHEVWNKPLALSLCAAPPRGWVKNPESPGSIIPESGGSAFRKRVGQKLGKRAVKTRQTIKWTDGKEYPLAKVEISSHSHPFYTGTTRIVDAEGRVEKFRKKYQKRDPKR